METLLLVNAVIVGAFALLYGSLLVICAPRSTWAVFVRGLDSFGRFARDVVDYTTAFFAIGVRSGVTGISEKESEYERDCREYADTLPTFSNETKRIMQREGHLPTSRRSLWSESPHYGPKAPGLMRVWPNGYPPTTAGFQGSDTLRNSPYAPRIVCEVVEVEEIEITSKSSAEVSVEGFERRYYQPIEEPDISRILLDD